MKYLELEKKLLELINNKKFKNNKFYTINEISKNFNVSNITSRRAVSDLCQKDILKSIRGSGIFINQPDIYNSFKKEGIYLVYFVDREIKTNNDKFTFDYILNKKISGILFQASKYNIPVHTISEGKFLKFIDNIQNIILREEFVPHCLKITNKINKKNIVIFNSTSPKYKMTTIYEDLFEGARSGVNYLIRNGHKNIAYVGDFEKWNMIKFKGYIKALEDNNITLNSKYIFEAHLKNNIYNISEIVDSIKEILKNTEITSIFFANDDRALYAYEYFARNNIKIPDRISLLSYNNSPECSFVIPTLTSIDPMYKKQGEMAVELLLNNNKIIHKKTNAELSIKNSVKKKFKKA